MTLPLTSKILVRKLCHIKLLNSSSNLDIGHHWVIAVDYHNRVSATVPVYFTRVYSNYETDTFFLILVPGHTYCASVTFSHCQKNAAEPYLSSGLVTESRLSHLG